jgi:nucleoside 2-deoxyribosyltransferase
LDVLSEQEKMSMKSIYLAGAITGESYGDATDWREYVRTRLSPGIVGLSPLRCKSYLEGEKAIGDCYDSQNGVETPLSTSRGIMTRDYYDCQNCDVILANLLNTKIVSIGTVMECGWAYAFGKPLIMVLEDEGNMHENAMLREATGFRVNTFVKAIDVANSILTDYTGKQ